MEIRRYDPRRDRDAVRACIVSLQEAERGLEPRLPSGAAVADDYLEWMRMRCREHDGVVLLADVDGAVVGFVCVWRRVADEEPSAGAEEYALISDLVVLEEHRGRGVARRLLAEAEALARAAGVRWLRVGVMAGNRPAQALYEKSGFAAKWTQMEKPI